MGDRRQSPKRLVARTSAQPRRNATDTGSVLFECVPDVTVEVVVSAEQQPAALAERHRRDAADDVVVRVHADLLVGADVEQSARRVVRTGREREPARKELPRRTRKTVEYLRILQILLLIVY